MGFEDLKSRFERSCLAQGVEYYKDGRLDEAVERFLSIKDVSSIDGSCRPVVKDAYYQLGKKQQPQDAIAALKNFEMARLFNPNDLLINERINLLRKRVPYATIANVATFRNIFGDGCSSGGYEKREFPFLLLADEHHIRQQPATPAVSAYIKNIYTVGVYRTQAQGRHPLSYAIRKYKGQNDRSLASPFSWLLADFVQNTLELYETIDVIVPSPSNPNKYVHRLFVPSLLIVQGLSEAICVPSRDLFTVKPMDCRFRQIPYEDGKKLIIYRDRKLAKVVDGKIVLLIDDVVTKGRTLTLLADILLAAGAKLIYGMALAKTGPAVDNN